MNAVNPTPMVHAGAPRRIQNRVYRQCAMDGFNARLAAELTSAVPASVPLYSHHSTRQSYFTQGWQAVTQRHLIRAKARALMAKE